MSEQNKTRKPRNLVAKKKEAYVWRVNSLGMGEHFNHIPCWYVVDKDTDEVISGGYNSGSNYQSGSANIPRRKDAKAFIDGYNAAQGESNPHAETKRTIERVGNFAMPTIVRTLKGADDETEAFWEDGNLHHGRGQGIKFSKL